MSLVRAILSALSWRKLAAMLALSFTMPMFALAVRGTPLPTAHAVAQGMSATVGLLIILGADEAAKRGGRLRYVNTLAALALLLGNFAIAAIAQRYFAAQFAPRGAPPTMPWTVVVSFGLGESLWSVFVLIVYLNRHVAERMLQGVQQVESQRMRQEAELVESRLRAAQTQVDPKKLFADLADIREKLQCGAPDADEGLDGLIQSLRSALARAVVASGSEANKT